ncbi:MAG: ORF6N domain-containing protein [Deltaproteobacteria bacterium]|nr:ORF6N domain-containing protein [Deltaproteobacteria bacterium]
MTETDLVSAEQIARNILLLRGQRVMLDRDLAQLYGVETRALVQAVKRNVDRFPGDFMFQLTADEARHSRSQIVILNADGTVVVDSSRPQVATLKRGRNIKYLPYAFTEQGVAMLSSVLRSPWAVQVNIEIMRAFVRLRRAVATQRALVAKIAGLENRFGTHDKAIKMILDAIETLMKPPMKPKRRIGF